MQAYFFKHKTHLLAYCTDTPNNKQNHFVLLLLNTPFNLFNNCVLQDDVQSVKCDTVKH